MKHSSCVAWYREAFLGIVEWGSLAVYGHQGDEDDTPKQSTSILFRHALYGYRNNIFVIFNIHENVQTF